MNADLMVNPSLIDEGVRITRPVTRAQSEILCPDALRFVARLVRRFAARRDQLLKLRAIRQKEIDAGKFPDFLPETAGTRQSHWTVAPIPAELHDRRVELVGPATAESIDDALASGVHSFVADFEDSNSPTWENCIQGQVEVRLAIARRGQRAHGRGMVFFVRPRGWHLDERHARVDGESVPAALFDFGLFFFHNAKELVRHRSAPYFYLPKLEGHLEAGLWSDVFMWAEAALGIRRGTVRATALVETVLAAFEMDEILFALRDYSAGLAWGRDDYTFSFIKRFRRHADLALPGPGLITRESGFLRSCATLLVHTCHRRGVHAIGGLTARAPIPDSPGANQAARDELREEARAGFDGTRVAHPDSVTAAKEAFESNPAKASQFAWLRDGVTVTAVELLDVPRGEVTLAELRASIRVAARYLDSWLRGRGAVEIEGVIEHAAAAELARARVWQWIRHGATTEDGRRIDRKLVMQTIADELAGMRASAGEVAYDDGQLVMAEKLLIEVIMGDELAEFFTPLAYQYLD